MPKLISYTIRNRLAKVDYQAIFIALYAQQARAGCKRLQGCITIFDRSSYARKCATGYRKNLAACKNEGDHKALFLATEMRLRKSSDEYMYAFAYGNTDYTLAKMADKILKLWTQEEGKELIAKGGETFRASVDYVFPGWEDSVARVAGKPYRKLIDLIESQF